MTQKRKSFSERMGITKPKSMQFDSIDERLKNALWNILLSMFNSKSNSYQPNRHLLQDLYLSICLDFFGDTFDCHRASRLLADDQLGYIRDWFFDSTRAYNKIYEFVEFLVPSMNTNYIEYLNITLEENVSGYRIVDQQISQITNNEEIEAINEATSVKGPVKTHLDSALRDLTKFKQPNYRNSVKESISAVESMCVSMSGNSTVKFGDALNKVDIPQSLKQAFHKLYGFTSNDGGIRHRLLEDDFEVTFEEAKFMLVTCSAFVNYLTGKISK